MAISYPFNFQPHSVVVQSGSYTIPAGFYANVVASPLPGGGFTINGSVAASGSMQTWDETHLSSSSLTRAIEGANAQLGLEIVDAINTNTGRTSAFGAETTTHYAITAPVATFWLPSGTVCNASGAGCRYAVTLYPNIT